MSANPPFPQAHAGQADLPEERLPYARLRLHRGFTSRFLSGQRDLMVYVPPGYDQQPECRYPVLYLHDGQNLFDGRAAFPGGKTWQVHEHADAVINAGDGAPLVIVGIYNAGHRRLAEYTPDHDPHQDGGDADWYGNMLVEELMPWTAAHYRVRTEPEATGLGGASLGGLATLYLGLRHAQHFGRLAVLSPSVWWNRKSILTYVQQYAQQISVRPHIWLDVGDREGDWTVENAWMLMRQLVAGGWRVGEDLHFKVVAGGAHDELSWGCRVEPMLRYLFPSARKSLHFVP